MNNAKKEWVCGLGKGLACGGVIPAVYYRKNAPRGVTMGIPCRMLPQLPYANQFRLLAGESGLGNEVQWVHYLEEPRYAAGCGAES